MEKLEEALTKSASDRSLGLAAGRESNVALPVDVDGQAEGVAVNPPGCEPELIWNGSHFVH